ncbi:cytochrome b-c1 complex subunit 8 [Neohortaea acidophila]|uniref:Cytochrome b-c1 complex subunit 8 n=1 Tax=Neohortaea acidophila TaxID=245834 RepID=A0A6A6PVK0_9PEZI|nr:cytochrome b-c1 complex subunit 8 [Neohortaea acidophila]KAF2484042.1 cytochrome b-c1 complex subunit 8 [Neohortaea acidophila]
MRPTQFLRSGGGEWKPGQYMSGTWGAIGSPPQKGIVHYGLSNNRLKPLAGATQAAIFNTFRRTRNQILFWSVPMLIGYELMQWATERNEYLNSKEGRELYGGAV